MIMTMKTEKNNREDADQIDAVFVFHIIGIIIMAIAIWEPWELPHDGQAAFAFGMGLSTPTMFRVFWNYVRIKP